MSDITLDDLGKYTFQNQEEFDEFRNEVAADDWLWSTMNEARPSNFPCVAVVQPVIYNNESGTAKLEVIFVYLSDFEPRKGE